MKLSAYHNSRIKAYRSPQGAVKCGQILRLVLKLAGSDAPLCRVLLRIWNNKGETLIHGERLESGDTLSFVFQITAPEKPQLMWYYFMIEKNSEKLFLGADSGEGKLCSHIPEDYQITVYDPCFETPDWFKKATVYQIFPDRFFRGSPDKTGLTGLERAERLKKEGRRLVCHKNWNEEVLFNPLEGENFYSPCDYYGGDLKGIEEKLPYLHEMGITAIYLNPVFEARSNHRYNTADYMKVDSILGENGDLKRLAESAKAYGINLILDGVFSHTGDDSVYFNHYGNYPSVGAYESMLSPYYEWYRFRHFPDDYYCWWNFTSLPEVNENIPSYMEFIGRVLDFWRKIGINSWRLDVADELPEEFIEFVRKRIKEPDKNGLLLGEVWEDASNKEFYGGLRKYVYGHELDSVMNYPFRDAVCAFFTGTLDAYGLNGVLAGQRERYPEPFYRCCMNILGSHDCQRILSVLSGAPGKNLLSREEQAKYSETPSELSNGKKRLKAASALQFSMPQPPCIYYGDEAGMTGLSDPFNRRPYPWGNEDTELLLHYRKLSAIRRNSPALTEGNIAFAAPDFDLFAVYRNFTEEKTAGIMLKTVCEPSAGTMPQRLQETMLTVVNRSPIEKRFIMDKTLFKEGADADEVCFNGKFTDLFTGKNCTAKGGKLTLQIQGFSFIMLKSKAEE